MLIGILKKGDEVLNVTGDFIAVRRKNGTVDIVPLIKDGCVLRIDADHIVTIGYGENIVSCRNENDVEIINF